MLRGCTLSHGHEFACPFFESGLDLAPAARMKTLRCRIFKAQDLRTHRHLQHTLAPVAEQIVGLDDVVEGEAVGDERERVEAA